MNKVEVNEVKETSETAKFTQEQLGVEINRQALIKAIADAPSASIIYVKNYEAKNGHGEVANFSYNKGVSYANMKDRSLEQLSFMESNESFSIVVKWNMWEDENGVRTTRKAKGRFVRQLCETYAFGHPLLTEAFAKVRKSLTAPQPSTAEYAKEGNGIYSLDGVLQIRDCSLIHKEVVKEGDYPITATEPVNALADTIRRLLPIGKYRQVRLDGRFDYISIRGQIVMQSEDGDKAYIGLNEHKEMLAPRIPDMIVM